MNDDWQDRVDALFGKARTLPISERAAFLDKQCHGERALREEVNSLLANISAEFMPVPDHLPPRPPQVPGYRILRFLDKGGMGDVWLAEQEHAVIRSKVALKVIHRGLDTDEMVARFETERQALALMNHPNIARVFDAGATQRGRPFFVMDYVKGLPVTKHCDQNRLGIRERLDLFMQICDGVQHAHQRAIIHRDIKPSNVLVSMKGDRPVPVIIDFGIAKITGHKLTEKSFFTDSGRLMGTPGYMSPEQAEMTGQDIDTRTDIYSLGVLLYELLAGKRPFELRKAGLDELRRQIREDVPQRPSACLATLGDQAAMVADKRQTSPGTHVRRIRGELDWITMKALEKERARRYSSASELAADLGRHLAGEPVLAGPPSATYHIRKLVGRHKAAALAAVLVTLSLLVGVVGTSIGLLRAKKAEQAARNAQLAAAEEAETARGLSEFWALIVRDEYLRAENLLQRCVMDREPKMAARCRTGLAWMRREEGDLEGAESLFLQAIETWEEHDPEAAELAELYGLLGWVRVNQGRWVDAVELLERALGIRERNPGSNQHDVALNLYSLAGLCVQIGDPDKARLYYRRAVDIDRAIFGRDDPFISENIKKHADSLRARGHHVYADALQKELLGAPMRSIEGTD